MITGLLLHDADGFLVEVLGPEVSRIFRLTATGTTLSNVMPALRIRAIRSTPLPGGDHWLQPGETALVPPYVVIDIQEAP